MDVPKIVLTRRRITFAIMGELYNRRSDVFTAKFYRIWWGKLRRWYLGKFRKAYVEKQLALRRGRCLQCGRCCMLGIRCPYLTEDNRCSIYNGKRPLQCKLFPIDERDLKDMDYQCGFYFVNKGES